jgi:hypothetical protein
MKLIVDTNSYVTISEADKIIANYLTSDDKLLSAYENLDDEDKSVILYKSCLDMQRLRYRGFKKEKNQTLSFPRVNKLGYKSNDEMVKLAQVINSLSFITGGSSTSSQIAELKDNGVSSFKLGAFSVSLHGQSSSKSNSGKVETFLSEWLAGGVPIR